MPVPTPKSVSQSGGSASSSPGQPMVTPTTKVLPTAKTAATPKTQPSDAIQKAMEATLASIELPPPPPRTETVVYV